MTAVGSSQHRQSDGMDNMRNPYDVLGVKREPRAKRRSRRRFASSPRSIIPTATRTTRRRRTSSRRSNSAYEILGDKEKRAQFDRGEIDAEGKPRFQGFEGFRRRPAAGARPEDFSGISASAPAAVRSAGARRAAADPSEESSRSCSARRSARPAARERQRRARPSQKGEDVEATLTVTLEDVASEAKKRIALRPAATSTW